MFDFRTIIIYIIDAGDDMPTLTRRLHMMTASAFPMSEVKRRLRVELEKIAVDAELLRPEWEPLLDSQRVVGTVLVVEELLHCKLPPEKVVQKGGYNSVDEAVNDMTNRIVRIVVVHN
jgi:hypothetical protein